MFCTIIEPLIRTQTQDSYDKSRVVSARDQIQYQICNIHLTHPLRLPYLPRLPPPVQTLHVAAAELTVSQAVTLAILTILTNHVPLCPANQDQEDQPPCTQPLLCQHQPRPIPAAKTFLTPRYPCGGEMGNLSTFSGVLLGTNQRKS